MKFALITTLALTSFSLYADNDKVLHTMHANGQTEKQHQAYVTDDIPSLEGMSEARKKELFQDVGNKSLEEIMAKYPEVGPRQIKLMMRRK